MARKRKQPPGSKPEPSGNPFAPRPRRPGVPDFGKNADQAPPERPGDKKKKKKRPF